MVRVYLLGKYLTATLELFVHRCGFSKEDFKVLSEFVISKIELNYSGDFQSKFLGEGVCPHFVVYIRDAKDVLGQHRLVMYSLSGVTICMSFPSKNFGTD